eukprot:m.224595 g.224595  ORF g.224595 m.224595 type:complete len:500 (-) comp11115_c0_seq1:53-1552(-)
MASEERQPLLEKSSAGVTESLAERKLRWRSIRSVYFTNFLNAIGFSILMSTLWPYLERVGGTKTFLGYLVSAFSFGQLIGSPYFGFWANFVSYKSIFFLTGLLKVGGNFMYAFAGAVGGRRDFFLLEARLLVGLGAGNMALCNAYVSQATNMEERTQAMAMLAATGGIGFIVGPLIGVSFGSMKPGYELGPLTLDYLTMPAVCCCVLEAVNQLCIIFFFRERRLKNAVDTASESGSIQLEGMNKDVLKTDRTGVWMMMLLYFGTMVVLSVFETVGTPLTMDEYGFNPQQADIVNGIIAGCFGVLCVIVLAFVKKLANKFGERQLLMFSLALTVVAMLMLIPWTSAKIGKIWTQTDDDDDGTRSGCEGSWCDTEPMLPKAQYLIGNVLVAIAYPISNVMEFSIFSKMLGPGPQGTMMGWLTSAGCLARALGPLYITQLYAEFGPRITFSVASGITLIMLLIGLYNYKRFVPHALHEQTDSASAVRTPVATGKARSFVLNN